MLFGAAASQKAPASETSIVARSGTAAVLLWDATSTVASMLQKKVPDDVILSTIELKCARMLALKAPALPKARTIEIRVIYARTGAVSPIYGTPDFVSFERLLTVGAAASVLRKGGVAMVQGPTIKNNRSFRITVTGKLPSTH